MAAMQPLIWAIQKQQGRPIGVLSMYYSRPTDSYAWQAERSCHSFECHVLLILACALLNQSELISADSDKGLTIIVFGRGMAVGKPEADTVGL